MPILATKLQSRLYHQSSIIRVKGRYTSRPTILTRICQKNESGGGGKQTNTGGYQHGLSDFPAPADHSAARPRGLGRMMGHAVITFSYAYGTRTVMSKDESHTSLRRRGSCGVCGISAIIQRRVGCACEIPKGKGHSGLAFPEPG